MNFLENYKLLSKTHSHYKTLIMEREIEIRKLEEKLLFGEQDFHNKKIKLDCMNIRIEEAEFHLKNLEEKLGQFDIVKLSRPKTTPVQKLLKDFPPPNSMLKKCAVPSASSIP